MSLVEFYLVRQYTSPVTNRHYVTKGKLIDWNGIDAHIEYISDETERINNQKNILELNKKLMISENLLQAVISHSGLFFLEYDVQKNCAMLDEKSQKELNLPRFVENYVETLIRKNIILSEFIEPFRKLHHDLKCGVREAEQTIRVLLPKLSRTSWVKICYTNIFDEKGTPIKEIGTGQNHDRYKELEEQFLISAKQMGITTWIYNIEKRQIHLNNNLQDNYGLKSIINNVPDSMIARKIIHPDDIETYRRMHEDIFNGGKNIEVILRIFSKNKQEYRREKISYTVVYDYLNNPIRAIGSGIDITEEFIDQTRYKEQINVISTFELNSIGSFRFNLTKIW